MTIQTRSHLPATGAILAPDTFAALATAKASTSGLYLSGLPLSAARSMVLWGTLQLVVSASMTAGTALVVAGRAGAVYRKGSLRIDISDSSEDFFLKNLLTVRVKERVAMATYKPRASPASPGS
jgi:Phage capsid family